MNTMLSNVVSSVTGNITKAILFVYDKEANKNTNEMIAGAKKLKDNILGSTASVLSLGNQTFSALTKNNVTNNTGYVALEVQYNPSSLSVSTQGVGTMIDFSDRSSVRASSIVQNFAEAISVLHCQLLFDDTNVADAFIQGGNLSLTPGGAITTVSNLVNTFKGNGYTVQPQMDAIMGLLTQDETRQVMFVWSDMCFMGELTSVDNTFTMFNKKGNPIRGTMDITIRQEHGDMDYWMSAFTKKFSNATTVGSTSLLGKITNNSLLNLNL